MISFIFRRFLLLFLVILSLFFSETYLYSKKNKNINIEKAEQLIKEKKYNAATRVLMDELVNDPENEAHVMRLLDKIERQKEKVINMIFLVKEKIKEGDFVKAEEVLNDLENSGEFDKTITKLINIILNERPSLERINSFNNNVIEKGEEYIVAFDIGPALQSYKAALDIYRKESSKINDNSFSNAVSRFNSAERSLLNSGIEKEWVKESKEVKYDFVKSENDKMISRYRKWREIESNFITVAGMLRNVSNRTKENIVYEAFNSITIKYINLIRRGIQKSSLKIIDYLFQIAENEMAQAEKGNNKSLDDLDRIFVLQNEVEKDSFYNITIDFNDEILINRSKKNSFTYLDYITKRNLLKIKAVEIRIVNDFAFAESKYNEFIAKENEKDLFEGRRLINTSNKTLGTIKKNKEEMNEILSPFKEFKNNDFQRLIQWSVEIDKKIEQLESKLSRSKKDLDNSIKYAEGLLSEADKKYDVALKNYKSRSYKKAKDGFEDTKDKYYEYLLVMRSDYVDERIEIIEKYLDNIEQVFFSDQISQAEQFIESAKIKFYAERYDDAKEDIDEADAIFIKYRQDRTIIEYYRERINSAIKIQSGSKLSVDDQAYEEILELFKNARTSYNNRDFKKALKYITQILLEKPYYKDARNFEIKILLETDPESFENIYETYLNKAKLIFQNKNYGDALVEFQQLLQFGRDRKLINDYIYQCKIKLNLTKPITSENDRNTAKDLIKEAQSSYANANYQQAYEIVNRAIRIWEDVPEARNLKLACMQKLKIERPKLTRENAIKYREAVLAYSENDFEKAFRITREILISQDFEEVRKLNRKADLKRR